MGAPKKRLSVAPLPRYRAARDFEALAEAADRMDRRPKVFLACVGPLAAHGARATFATHLFHAGGLDVEQSAPDLDADALASAFSARGAPFACLCATDDGYAEHAQELCRALDAAGPERGLFLHRRDDVYTDFFTIDLRRTGREFATVGNTPAAGFSLPGEQLHYEMKDYAPYSGKSYYRLKTKDFDGFISLSHLVEVNYDGKQDWGFTLFPNPNSGQHFNIRSSGLEAGDEVTLEVFDVQGRLIQRNPLTAMEQDATLIRLQQKLSSGSYLIRLSHPEEGQQSKILLVGER